MKLPEKLSRKTVHAVSETLAAHWAANGPPMCIMVSRHATAEDMSELTRDFYDALVKNIDLVELDLFFGVNDEEVEEEDEAAYLADAPPDTFTRAQKVKAALFGRADPYQEVLQEHIKKKKAERGATDSTVPK